MRRVISDAAWRRKAAEFFIDAATKVTETFLVSVNPDSRWRSIDRANYYYVDGALTVDDFPISGSAGEVTMTYVTLDHEPSTQEVLDEFKRRGLKRPDRAQVESFLEQNPGERQKYPVIGLCGSRGERRGVGSVAYVYADSRDIGLGWDGIDNRWGQVCRFLAVVSQ